MTKNTKLGFIRLAFAATVGFPLFIATSAFAQNPAPAPAGEATTQAVIVTGTNIPTAEEVTPSPLDTLTTEDIARSGSTDVLSVLQKRDPDFIGGGNLGSSNANISSGGTQGGSIASLRGLPTLVLFNGRRIADSAAISTGGAQFSDVSLFPSSLIARIEVLKDGASAIYGSDAVGGVINIFLKQDYTGMEAGFRYGFTVEPGVAERRAYVIAGVGNDTTHVTAGYQYYEIDPLFLRERQYSRLPVGGVTTTYAGSARQRPTAILDPNGRLLMNDGLNSPFDNGVVAGSIPASPNPPQYNNALMNNSYHFATDAQVFAFDLSTQPTSTLDISNHDAYMAFTHQICGKQLEAFGDFLYAHNHNESRLNAQPLSNGTGVVILGSMRVDPNTGNLVPENRGTPAAFNPFQESLDGFTLAGPHRLTIGNRYQTNPRIFTDDNDFFRVLGGLRSQINDKWFAEAATYYSHYGITFVNNNLVNALQLNSMIAGTATDNNGLPIPAFDFFARNPVGTNPGQVTQAQFNTIFGANIRQQSTFQRGFDFRITGFPFELPGGPVGVSTGVEYRVEGFKVKDSPEIFVGSVPIQEITTDRNVLSANAEFNIPIVGSQQNIPFIYNMEVNIAGRWDTYEHVKEDAKVPKVTFRYQPIKDVTIRATYANSFVAPNLFQLFGPTAQGFSDTITFNGVVQDQAQVLAGSNPSLKPSTAESWTAGIVISPHWVPGLVVTADFFHTLQQQIVSALGGAKILGSVEALGPGSPYYNLVAFNNFPGFPGAIPTGPAGSLNGNLAATFYIDNLLNIGAARVEGFDLSAHYNLDLQTFGQFEFGINAILFTMNDLKSDPFVPYYSIKGLVGSEFGFVGGANPDYKVTALVEYRYKGAILGFNANYIPEMKNTVGHDPETEDHNTFDTVPDYVTVDGRLSYEFTRKTAAPAAVTDAKDAKDGKAVAATPGAPTCNLFDRLVDGLKLTVGCNNILDEDPRLVRGANSGTSLSTYDPFGRFVYFEVAHKF